MLELKNVEAYYPPKIRVLRGISLRVEKGETLAIVGSNGAGKTTIMRAISGIVVQATGKILFEGNEIQKLSPHERVMMGIIHCPERRRVFAEMTVLENLEVGAYTIKQKDIFKQNLERVFSLFPILKERKKQMAQTLSGGEQQMLAIGRALMANPKILLLDEPSLGLAPVVRKALSESLKKLQSAGLTILLTEQNVNFALGLAKRMCLLENGEIIYEGTRESINKDFAKKLYF